MKRLLHTLRRRFRRCLPSPARRSAPAGDSVPEAAEKERILTAIGNTLGDDEAYSLRHSVEVAADFLGENVRLDIRRIRRLPGSLTETREYLIGRDPHGNDYTTEHLDEGELRRIHENL